MVPSQPLPAVLRKGWLINALSPKLENLRKSGNIKLAIQEKGINTYNVDCDRKHLGVIRDVGCIGHGSDWWSRVLARWGPCR